MDVNGFREERGDENIYRPFLQSLSLNELIKSTSKMNETKDDLSSIECILCDETFNLVEDKKELLTHLIMSHKLVISDVNKISEFSK